MLTEDSVIDERVRQIAADPEGHCWTFSQAVRTVSNEEMEKASGFKFEPLR